MPSPVRADAAAQCRDATLALDQRLVACESARQNYRAVLRQDPGNEAAREGCRAILEGLNYGADAIERSLDLACARIRDNDAGADLAEYLAEEGITEPIDPFALHYVAAEGVDPAADALFRQAVALAAEGDVTFAAAAYAAAARIDPVGAVCDFQTNEDALVMRLYDQSVRPNAYGGALVPRTLDELNVALSASRTDPYALRERALLYAAVKAWKRAFDDLQLALVSDPHPDQVYVLLAWMGFALDRISRIAVTNHLITGVSQDAFDTPRLSFDRMLAYIEDARRYGAEGFFVEATRGRILSGLAAIEDSDDRAKQAIDAYNFALTYVGNPEVAGDLGHWSAMAAYFGRAMARIRLGMTDISNDMDAMGAYSMNDFPSVCPAD